MGSNARDLTALTNDALSIRRSFAQNVLLSSCFVDPMSTYMKKKSCKEGDSYLYKWYFKIGMSIKKLLALIYLLSYSFGSIAQYFWSPPRPDEKNWILLNHIHGGGCRTDHFKKDSSIN
ncbi:hypothetical protein AMTRI_Chr06g174520 [Amborella trichopoda]